MTSIKKVVIAGKCKKSAPLHLGLLAVYSATMFFVGCSSGSTKSTTTQTQAAAPQTYMAPYVIGDKGLAAPPGYAVYADQFDETAMTFSKSTYYIGAVEGAGQEGIRTYYAGSISQLARGLLSLGLTLNWNSAGAVTYSPPQTGSSWAVELPGQAGGLVQFNSGPVEPMTAAMGCPDFSTPQNYQFLTLPAPFPQGSIEPYTWDPTQETVYGSVEISGTGSTITFDKIRQYAQPMAPGGPFGATAYSVISPTTGTCSSNYYGYNTVVPGDLSVTDPGPGGTAPPVALIGIGPTGLLVESNAANGESASGTASPLYYENLLGAGTGAIGLPAPPSPVSTSDIVGAQYLGFFYGSGDGNNDWSTYVASFGFAKLPGGCATVAKQTTTMIYGGDFPANNPGGSGVQSTGGYGSCDIAIDLGTQDPNNNGLFPAATVYVGSVYAANELGINYNFPAVAIAGQLGGKFAVFLLGIDTVGYPSQAWGIYLIQSN